MHQQRRLLHFNCCSVALKVLMYGVTGYLSSLLVLSEESPKVPGGNSNPATGRRADNFTTPHLMCLVTPHFYFL